MEELHLSLHNRKIAGVCGGLSESTRIDADLFRVGFLLSILASGMGVLVYIILWIILPEKDYGPEKENPGIFSQITRSSSKKMIAGICGGIAEYLELDVSIIRLLLILFVLAGGIGIPIYLVLWFMMPLETEKK